MALPARGWLDLDIAEEDAVSIVERLVRELPELEDELRAHERELIGDTSSCD